MANRPVFVAVSGFPYVNRVDVDFVFYPGFSAAQAVRSIDSLHQAYTALQPEDSGKILEISSKSKQPLGRMLSAFNLLYRDSQGKRYPVENAFQAGKCFELGGPYTDLLSRPAWEAKKDARLKSSGALTHFMLEDSRFSLEPRTAFYDWIYVNALAQNPQLSLELLNYNAFTDIVFNPRKSLNCQAHAAALYVALSRCGLLDEALADNDVFRQLVYRV